MKPLIPIYLFCAAMATLPVSGQTKTMIVTDRSSASTEIPVTTGTRISFSKDLSKMLISSGTSDNPLAFDIDGIAKIAFDMKSSVNSNFGDPDELEISNRGGIVTISAPQSIDYAVWDSAGRQILAGRGDQTVTLDFTVKTAGIYIIRANNKTVKFINR